MSYARDKSRASALSRTVQAGFAYGAKPEKAVGVGLFFPSFFFQSPDFAQKLDIGFCPVSSHEPVQEMCKRKPARSEPERGEQPRTGQVCVAASVGRTKAPTGGEGESWDGKRFWQLPRDTPLGHWETEQGNRHRPRHFPLALFCGLESNLNRK